MWLKITVALIGSLSSVELPDKICSLVRFSPSSIIPVPASKIISLFLTFTSTQAVFPPYFRWVAFGVGYDPLLPLNFALYSQFVFILHCFPVVLFQVFFSFLRPSSLLFRLFFFLFQLSFELFSAV